MLRRKKLAYTPPMPVACEAPPASVLNTSLILIALLGCVLLASRRDPLDIQAKYLQVFGLLISVASVTVPGRFDEEGDIEAVPWPTLISPAGYAFAIWGLIYSGELLGVAMAATCPGDGRASSRSWVCANLAQALWCMAFRQWSLNQLWLPTACLAATAYCLYCSQVQLLAEADDGQQPQQQWMIGWPRSVHLGWVTAAMLVNFNAWAGYSAVGPALALATAILSIAAAILIADVFVRTQLPAAASAIAWALFAISKGVPIGTDAAALGELAIDGLRGAARYAAALVIAAAATRSILRKNVK